MTTFNIATLPANPIVTPGISPIFALIGTSVIYNPQVTSLRFNRTNGGTDMTDTLPFPNVGTGNIAPLPNGFNFHIQNIDASAQLTLTPATGCLINGGTSLIINALQGCDVYTDGYNWFTSVSNNGQNIGSVVLPVTGSPINLGLYASGSIITRANATVAMADTLPNANTLPNGWVITLFNIDASATDTITPSGCLINGAANLAVTFGKSTVIYGNGTNYIAKTPA